MFVWSGPLSYLSTGVRSVDAAGGNSTIYRGVILLKKHKQENMQSLVFAAIFVGGGGGGVIRPNRCGIFDKACKG